MSATANLFASDAAGLEDQPESSSPLPAFSFANWQNYLPEPIRTEACEAIVNQYEPNLNAADGVILHLGAGRGELMEALRQHGFAVMGCEPSPGPTRLAQTLHCFDAHTLHCSNAEKFLQWTRRIRRKVQAIFFRHEWEHSLEFQALLPRMAEMLHDNGLVIALLPPPVADYPCVAHLSFLNELAVAGASSSADFEIESIDCDFKDRFMAFVLKKTSTERPPGPSPTGEQIV